MTRPPKHCTPKRILLALALLLTACVGRLPASPQQPAPPFNVPTLPSAARQEPTPSECSPTCSAGVTLERGVWLKLLTVPESPASSASVPTTR